MERLREKPNPWAALRAAFPATVPVLTGFLCLGVAYGLLMQTNGYGPLWSTLMSAIGFGGSMQYVAITLLVSAFDPLQAFLLALMVNARHVFYGLSMLDKYKGLGKARFFLVFALCDETFSLVSTLEPPEGVARKDFCFWITLLDYSYWVIATALGGLLGDAERDNGASAPGSIVFSAGYQGPAFPFGKPGVACLVKGVHDIGRRVVDAVGVVQKRAQGLGFTVHWSGASFPVSFIFTGCQLS